MKVVDRKKARAIEYRERAAPIAQVTRRGAAVFLSGDLSHWSESDWILGGSLRRVNATVLNLAARGNQFRAFGGPAYF